MSEALFKCASFVALVAMVLAGCGGSTETEPSTVESPPAAPSESVTSVVGQPGVGTTSSGPTTSTSSSTLPEDPICPSPEPIDHGDGFFTSYADQLIELRALAERIGGGFSRVTLLDVDRASDESDAALTFDLEIRDILWEPDKALHALDSATLNRRFIDPDPIEVPVEAVAFMTNDGVMWTVSTIDDAGCIGPLRGMEEDQGVSLVGQLLALIDEDRWERRVGMPLDSFCDMRETPDQPKRHDLMIVIALERMTEVQAERDRLQGIRQLADRVGERNRANHIDIEHQLLAGVAEDDLDFQRNRSINVRLPGLARDDAYKLTVVLLEGDPPVFSAWYGPDRARVTVELPLPRGDNVVRVYVGTFADREETVDEFPSLPRDWDCAADYADMTPYALIPAAAFQSPNETINLNDYRP